MGLGMPDVQGWPIPSLYEFTRIFWRICGNLALHTRAYGTGVLNWTTLLMCDVRHEGTLPWLAPGKLVTETWVGFGTWGW